MKPSANIASSYWRQVFITNVLSFIFCWVALGIAGIYYSIFGWLDALSFIIGVAFCFLLVPAINRINHSAGRMVFCLIPVWLTLIVTIYFKLSEPQLTFVVYFDSRFILMATPVLPGIVFRLQERAQLLICMGSAGVALLLYDPIHEFLNAGFFQQGFTDPSYYYINYIVGVTFFVLLFGILLMRSVMEKSEADLEQQNKELQHKQHEIEAQHEELLQHQEEVMSSSEKLEAANIMITRQQQALEKYNAQLEALVAEKSQDLLNTNKELVRHNNELLQFSYTVSHNLRGPVARLLGLTRLFNVTSQKDEKIKIENLILKSSEELDEILRDLSLIIDIRNEIYRVREKVFFADELKKALLMLGENVKPEYKFEIHFKSPLIFGVRPMVQSILYNLVSNAIKYQSPDRPLKIHICSKPISEFRTTLEISDNGLGFDLASQKDNIFKLYKRFHSHVGGKGLGLYLVKTQVEALGGEIDVESSPNRGATFKIVFNQPEGIHKQIFHESEAAQLYYDGNLKICVIQWKKNVTSDEYRETFSVVLNSLKHYKTPGWISDVRKQGIIGEDDQKWLLNTLGPEAISNGLRQIAMVCGREAKTVQYIDRIKRASSSNNVTFRVFESMEQAYEWMQETL